MKCGDYIFGSTSIEYEKSRYKLDFKIKENFELTLSTNKKTIK